jgi:hypothetical protein
MLIRAPDGKHRDFRQQVRQKPNLMRVRDEHLALDLPILPAAQFDEIVHC